MLKGSKEALTVLIVTHVTHAKGVKRSLNSFTHNFLNIQPIFSPQKVLESWDLDLSNHTNAMYVKGVKSYFDFQPLRHASTYIALDGMVAKV